MSTYPFFVSLSPSPDLLSHRVYQIQAALGNPALEQYLDVFEEYGFGGNGPSWEEHVAFLLAAEHPDLLERLEFDCEGDTFLVYADSQAVAERFLAVVCP